ncbi:mitochondrial carrier [Tilletiaria anomala UBC 951]|uniref:Mitochondrial carrier n=1 Tax=Tilletiaria anomala (strain ATCC 24038 / CBS 436.72 / UBC 951) TaxID=1037660 RepID=A0A066VTN3_TILAU|nr:mitochondrial carrier [Tilletiaria anomala UBC 951]KDN45087.1 mitochondrial carrier [Tilletiaria anomala UBC 951]
MAIETSDDGTVSSLDIKAASSSRVKLSDPTGKSKAADQDDSNWKSNASFKGFAAGTVSGLTKLAVGHPFDTIKIRMQVSPYGTFKGPGDALMQLIRKERIFGLYKGATPPAVGWAFTDSVLLGSLHNYRLMFSRLTGTGEGTGKPLPTYFHAISGLFAGWTNSLFTTPMELIKSKLQMQHQKVRFHIPGRTAGGAAAREFSGPINCVSQIVQHSGVRGMWHGLPANLLFRSNFAIMFGCYDWIHVQLSSLRGTRFEMSDAMRTFLAGGLAAELYWLVAFPSDVVKNRIMADSLRDPQHATIRSAFRSVWNHDGPNASVMRRVRTLYTGFLPCILRAFPTNAAALTAFEWTMRLMEAENTANH